MTEANQKKLYDYFVDLSKNGKDEAQRANCKGYAADILKSFPHFNDGKKNSESRKPKEKKLGETDKEQPPNTDKEKVADSNSFKKKVN